MAFRTKCIGQAKSMVKLGKYNSKWHTPCGLCVSDSKGICSISKLSILSTTMQLLFRSGFVECVDHKRQKG